MSVFEKESQTFQGKDYRDHLNRNWEAGDNLEASFNKQISQVYKDVPSGSADEITQARIDDAGKEYPTLKPRLDNTQRKADHADALIGNKADKDEVDSYLKSVTYVPETVASIEALNTAHPNGSNGLYVTANTGHKYIWESNAWIDAGIYQSVGIADGTITNNMLADGTIDGDKIDPEYTNGLAISQNQTPMHISTLTFKGAISSAVDGYIYVQQEPIYKKGKLTISVIAYADGDYNFFTFKKSGAKMTITAKITASLTAGLNVFESDLEADGGITYYGMQAKNGTPMQRAFRYYPIPYVTASAVVDASVGAMINVHQPNLTGETEGFFAEVLGDYDLKKFVKSAKLQQEFLDSSTSTTYSQGTAANVMQSTTSATDRTVQSVDKNIFTFWGSRLKKQNTSFSGFSCKVLLSTLDYVNTKYRFCGVVQNFTNYEQTVKYVDIDPTINYSNPTEVFFDFDDKIFNLNDDVMIGISIVDADGILQSTDSTGAIMTDGFDDNLYDDGKNAPWHAIYYVSRTNQKITVDEMYIGMNSVNDNSNSKNYYGLDYKLYLGKMDVAFKLNDQETNEKFKKIDDQIDYLTGNLGKVIDYKSALKFRPSVGNFEKAPDVYFLGRWFETDQGVMTINQGAEIDAKFEGTSISANITALATLPCLAVSIDGEEFKRVQMNTSGTVSLATGLSAGNHYIRLIIDGVAENDDLWVGHKGIIFTKFIVDSDESIKTTPVRAANKVAWFIGDSITAGINVLGNGANPTVNSATHAYDFIASTKLNLANIRIAFGATGLTCGGSGGVPSAINYLDYAASGVAESVEDYPDLIVVNHGTNDGSASATDYVNAYRTFLNQLSIKCPGIPIFAMIPFNGKFAADFDQVIDGYANVYVVDTTSWNIAGPNTGHPDVDGSVKAGTNLAKYMQQVLGTSFFA